MFFHNIIEFDQDLGRHLLMGQIILDGKFVPQTNLLSYTHPNFPFINSHWLSEVVFYLIGSPTLLYFKTLILVTAGTLTVWTAFRYSKNLAATAVSFLIFVPVLLERTEIRPEIFSYLFVAIFLYLLLFGKKNWLWALPVIQIFWVNAHIYFILGPALIFVFAISRRDKFLAVLGIISTFVCLLNPNGIAGALNPLQVFGNYGYTIVENQNIFFLAQVTNNPNILYFWIGVVFFIASFVLSKKITLINLMLTGFLVLPILHIRSFPLLFLILLPIFAFNLANIRFRIPYQTYIVIFVVAISFLRVFRLMTNDYYLSTDSPKRFGNTVSESGKGAVDFVISNKLKGPIFNNFDIGSYLDYRLYPKTKVFVDGRPEAYPTRFFQNVYIPMQANGDNFEKVSEVYKFNTIIFAHTDGTPWAGQFLSEIVKNPKWHLVYLDPYAVVFSTEKREMKLVYGKDYFQHLTLANALFTFGQMELGAKSLESSYAKNPNSKAVLSAIGQVYANDPLGRSKKTTTIVFF